jgi:hypothetical protein
MPFQEDFREFLDIEQGFAISAIVTPALGEPYIVQGIISEDYSDIDVGSAGFAGNKPIFECAEEDLGKVEYGDLLRVKGKDYRITIIRPDGNGWVSLLLERQS